MIVEKTTSRLERRSKAFLESMIQDLIDKENEAEIHVKARNIKEYISKHQDL